MAEGAGTSDELRRGTDEAPEGTDGKRPETAADDALAGGDAGADGPLAGEKGEGDAGADGDGTAEDEGDADGSPAAPESLERRAISAARGAATGAATTLRGGLSAMRDVRAASREHAGAQRRVRSMTEALEEDSRTLAHRQDVEGRYGDIVAEQSEASRRASQAMQEAQATVERLGAEASSLEDRLAKMRTAHEQELRPYRRVMETSRGRASDASQTVAEARRAVKGAEAQVKEATDGRTQGIAQANRTLDNSQERLRRVQEDLRRAQADPSAKADAVAQLQRENVAELAHVEAARAEVTNATRATQEAVEKAQMHLWTQKQSLETAQADADAAKRDYEGHKAEYDRRAAEAAAQEKELSDAVAERRAGIESAKASHDEAADAYDDAQGLLAEAEAIHATPEETERLAASIAEQQAALESAQSELEDLAHNERALRQHTRTERYILVAVLALLVVLAVLLAVAVVGPK